jgi:PIN domain nuclease of toxin-antitoxin system
MKYLLDTHIFIWWSENNPILSKEIREVISNPKNSIYVSLVSAWEIVIKSSIKKIKLKASLPIMVSKSRFELMSINLDHILALQKLPTIHKDPFDRLLVAQAKSEKIKLLTSDPQVIKYL